MKLRFVFYKAKIDGRPLDDAINIWTGILALFSGWGRLKYNYSHAEVWLPDEQGYFKMHWRVGGHVLRGRCFSSTTRGSFTGVRFENAKIVLKNEARWDWLEFEVDNERYEVVCELMAQEEGKPYDYAGLFSFFNPFNTQKKDAWYCSEICSWAAWLASDSD